MKDSRIGLSTNDGKTNIDFAKKLMKEIHKDQTRWDGRPYEVHPENVVQILKIFGINDENVLVAGYLHDALEDTDLSSEYIESEFNAYVLSLVKELTFSKGTDDYYINKCRNLSKNAKIIKVADILSNITDKGIKSKHYIDKRIAALQAMLNPINEQMVRKQ